MSSEIREENKCFCPICKCIRLNTAKELTKNKFPRCDRDNILLNDVRSFDIWADLEEIFSLPFGVGEKMQEAGQSLPRARPGDDLEYFLPPIARPKVNTNVFVS